MSYTLEQKYDFLMSHIIISDVDYWEKDALLGIHQSYYFQFDSVLKPSKEYALEQVMLMKGIPCVE